MPLTFHRHFITAAALLLCCSAGGSAHSQAWPQQRDRSVDVAVSFLTVHSLRASTTQNFWMYGGGAEAGTGLWRGLGAAVNFSGSHTDSIGNSGVPLSLFTFTAGPRFRLRSDRGMSPYGEALFGMAHGFNSLFPKNLAATADTQANSFAMQLGGGVDLRMSRAFSVRLPELAYVRTYLPNGTNDLQNNLRIGAGVTVRFGGKH